MGHASEAVLHLMDDYLGKGNILYMDNFYNSVALKKLFSVRKTYEKLRSNRKENHKDLVQRKLKKGNVAWHEMTVLIIQVER